MTLLLKHPSYLCSSCCLKKNWSHYICDSWHTKYQLFKDATTLFNRVFTCNKMLRMNQTNRVRTNNQKKQIFCVFDVFVVYAVFNSFPVVRTICSKYDIILKQFPGFCGVIFKNFWENSVKTVKKLLGICRYQKN